MVAGTLAVSLNPHSGLVNRLIDIVAGIKPDWFSNGKLALTMLIVTAIWNNLGYNLVFFLAGLQNIPESFMEAKVDGASFWEELWYIVIPSCRPTFFLLVININYAFFDTVGMVDVMTQADLPMPPTSSSTSFTKMDFKTSIPALPPPNP